MSRIATPAVLAALFAVALWSLKPIFISIIDSKIGFSEAYLISGSLAVILGSTVMLSRADTRRLLSGGRATARAVAWSAVAGFFLGMWYYGFYRALYGASKTDATIISFTWPLISVVAVRLIAPSTAPSLTRRQWGLIVLSMLGAVAISASGSGGLGASAQSGEIVWAFVAALGSGMYLPFAIKATHPLSSIPGGASPMATTFFSISTANLASLVTVSLAVLASGRSLDFSGAADASVLVVCAAIGVGTYLLAEVAWTWAFQEHRSLTLSAFPYFSPVVSVALLWVVFGERVGVVSVLGMGVILVSNLVLHRSRGAGQEPALVVEKVS